MKNTFAVCLFIVFAMAAPAWAQQMKIGFIDVQKAIGDSQAGKKARERFQAQVKKVEADLMREKQEAERLKGEVDKKGPLLKEDDRRKLEADFQRKYLSYQRNMRDFQEELRQKEGEMTAEILRDLEKVIIEIGRSEKFTLIFERSQLLYSDQAIDITGKVVETYNRSPASSKTVKGK